MNVHPLTSELVEFVVKALAVPVLWIAAWRIFKDVTR